MNQRTEKAETLTEKFLAFYRRYYREEVAQLAQHYPNEQTSLTISYADLFQYDDAIAEDWMKKPRQMREHAEEALELFDLPVDVSLAGVNVHLGDLDPSDTFYPGGFSPSTRLQERPYIALEGQIEKTTSVYPKALRVSFICARCGTPTEVPQDAYAGDFQEPYDCHGCDRKGPWDRDDSNTEFADGQKLRLTEPPEQTGGAEGDHIDVYLSNDLVDIVDPGDRVTIAGEIRFVQKRKGNRKSNQFKPYLIAHAVEVTDTDYEDIEILPSERERIEELAAGAEGDIFELAKQSIAPKIRGHDTIKQALFLLLIGGVRATYPDGSIDRGDTHILLIGDPGTAKSSFLRAVQNLAPRAVYANGKGATAAGMTGAAVRSDFGESEWTIEGGALVKAHKGVACVDEIDKIESDAVSSMHGALSDQKVDINKAGINTTLQAETALLAAGNPKYGRWDDYGNGEEQITLDETLLSRFGLIFKLKDKPDAERDAEIASHIVEMKEAAKAREVGDEDEAPIDVEPAIPRELLRKYIAFARRQEPPRFKAPEERSEMVESFVTFRGANGYDDDAPVPVTMRKLEDIHRLAEASARARLSKWIEEEDIQRARKLVGESLRQYGQNEEGQFDTDVVETGASKTQTDRLKIIEEILKENQEDYEKGMPYEDVCEIAASEGISEENTRDTLRKMVFEEGWAYEPRNGQVMWMGRS